MEGGWEWGRRWGRGCEGWRMLMVGAEVGAYEKVKKQRF